MKERVTGRVTGRMPAPLNSQERDSRHGTMLVKHRFGLCGEKTASYCVEAWLHSCR